MASLKLQFPNLNASSAVFCKHKQIYKDMFGIVEIVLCGTLRYYVLYAWQPCSGGKPWTVTISRFGAENRSCTGRIAHLTWRKIDFLVCLGTQLYISHHSRYQLASPWKAALTALLFLCRFSVIQLSNALHAAWLTLHTWICGRSQVCYISSLLTLHTQNSLLSLLILYKYPSAQGPEMSCWLFSAIYL